MMEMFEVWQLWLMGGMTLIILEALIPGFILAGIGFSALLSSLAAYLGMGFGIQGLVLFLASGGFFLTIRPLAMKFLYASKPENRTNTEALLGRTGIVTQAIEPHKKLGRVSIGDSTWIGISHNDTMIPEETLIEIVKVSGASLIVKRKEG